MKKRYLRLAALTAGVLLAAQTGLSAAALSTFDAAYYAAQYPDVAAVCGNDEGALLRHYLDHGIDEGRKPSADGIAGDDELSLTEAQFSSVWSPVAINKLAHYKSLKRKCTDEEFAQAYQEALKVVTPLALMSREDQLYGIASALRAVVDDGSMAYSMEANHYNDPYGYFVLRTASCAGCARATALCLDILGTAARNPNPISTRIFEKADKPFQNHAMPGRLCYLPGIAFFLSPFIKPLLYVEKLQIGTVLPVVSDLYREFAELSAHFDLRAIQSAQKQLRMLCNFHENTFGLLIFYANYAIL